MLFYIKVDDKIGKRNKSWGKKRKGKEWLKTQKKVIEKKRKERRDNKKGKKKQMQKERKIGDK